MRAAEGGAARGGAVAGACGQRGSALGERRGGERAQARLAERRPSAGGGRSGPGGRRPERERAGCAQVAGASAGAERRAGARRGRVRAGERSGRLCGWRWRPVLGGTEAGADPGERSAQRAQALGSARLAAQAGRAEAGRRQRLVQGVQAVRGSSGAVPRQSMDVKWSG
ncbi:hypothetical protein PAHAL_6G150600 [Panicum hallii]|uniref:Uncharacterized protein n=1 Tax=Panicum hallii TaxID=206008 RepID=A0A2T8IGA4_9POAL|nr:hypothetical protein PAHAL_6G150500 [Panicum hallii]PVH36719.1 hypothetical protein PAHAL_6G150600 [Panicum hallii]